jgi:hypothetical protein
MEIRADYFWLHDIRHNDIQHNYTQHNVTRHGRLICDSQDNGTQHKELGAIMLNVTFFIVTRTVVMLNADMLAESQSALTFYDTFVVILVNIDKI